MLTEFRRLTARMARTSLGLPVALTSSGGVPEAGSGAVVFVCSWGTAGVERGSVRQLCRKRWRAFVSGGAGDARAQPGRPPRFPQYRVGNPGRAGCRTIEFRRRPVLQFDHAM